MSRQYEPAWLELKRSLLIRIGAHPKMHARILKAIIKEKDMDTIYKLELEEARLLSRISSKRNGGELVIRLNVQRTYRIAMIDFPLPQLTKDIP